MADIVLECSICGESVQVSKEHLGQHVTCRRCGHIIASQDVTELVRTDAVPDASNADSRTECEVVHPSAVSERGRMSAGPTAIGGMFIALGGVLFASTVCAATLIEQLHFVVIAVPVLFWSALILTGAGLIRRHRCAPVAAVVLVGISVLFVILDTILNLQDSRLGSVLLGCFLVVAFVFLLSYFRKPGVRIQFGIRQSVSRGAEGAAEEKEDERYWMGKEREEMTDNQGVGMKRAKVSPWFVAIVGGALGAVLAGGVLHYLFAGREQRLSTTVVVSMVRDAHQLLAKGMPGEALPLYREALTRVSDKKTPFVYASIKLGMGNCYLQLADTTDMEDNLKKAVGAYEEALLVYEVGKYPAEYGTVMCNLAVTFHALSGIRDREGYLTRAISIYEQSLKGYLAVQDSVGCAKMQVSLGQAYADLSDLRNTQQNIAKSIAALRSALTVLTIEAHSAAYCTAQNNLGNAYSRLGDVALAGGNREMAGASLETSIESYRESLKVATVESFPLEYARAQNNIGEAFKSLAQVRDELQNLRRAIDALQAALSVYTIERYPVIHAGVQRNLGQAYNALSRIDDRETNLLKAIEAFDRALTVCSLAEHPYDYARIQSGLGNTYWNLAYVQDKHANLVKSLRAFEEAWKIFSSDAYPVEHGIVKRNMGRVREELGE